MSQQQQQQVPSQQLHQQIDPSAQQSTGQSQVQGQQPHLPPRPHEQNQYANQQGQGQLPQHNDQGYQHSQSQQQAGSVGGQHPGQTAGAQSQHQPTGGSGSSKGTSTYFPTPQQISSLVERFKDYTTCDVSDALVKLSDPTGGFIPGPTMWSPQRQAGGTRVVGPAYTVTYAPISDPRPALEAHYIDSVPPGSIVFISSTIGPISNAMYGGMMSTCAQARAAVGAVIDGRIRDLEEHRTLKFPVFARDVGTAPPAPFLKVVAIQEPIAVSLDGGNNHSGAGPGGPEKGMVRSGDVIMADSSGVVCIPASQVEDVLGLIPRLIEADGRMVAALKVGMGYGDAVRKFRSGTK